MSLTNYQLTQTPIGSLPSVTLVLSETTDKTKWESWQKRIGFLEASYIRRQAIERGKKLDSEIQHFFETGWVDQSEYFQQSYSVISEFTEHQLQQLVWHPAGYCGKFDYLGTDRTGQSVLVEWKTSTKPKPKEWTIDAQLQAVAYLKAAEYSKRITINEARVVYCITDHQIPDIYPIKGDKINQLFEQFCVRLNTFYCQLEGF